MQIYLATTPENLREALRYTDRAAHVAYRVGRDGHLTRQNLLARTQGGLMVLGDQDCGAIRDSGALVREVWRECGNRGFPGVLADFEQPPSADRTAFLEAYGQQVPRARVLICTAISGGTLRTRLEEAAGTFGIQRLALDLQRLRMSFPLPCPTGEGEPLSGEALSELLSRKGPGVFYSADLCAKYFTSTGDGESRFVLFDDAGTLRRKIQMGNELGIGTGFLMYPEVSDLLPELFRRGG